MMCWGSQDTHSLVFRDSDSDWFGKRKINQLWPCSMLSALLEVSACAQGARQNIIYLPPWGSEKEIHTDVVSSAGS